MWAAKVTFPKASKASQRSLRAYKMEIPKGYPNILFKNTWPKAISLERTRTSIDDNNRHPMARVDPKENTRLRTYPIKEKKFSHFFREDTNTNI